MTMLWTQSHKAAHERLLQAGGLFYSGKSILPKLKLRPQMLVVGPTGVGKSHLMREVASGLQAAYCKLTRGDWIVMGSRAGRPTSFMLLDLVVSHPRCLIHLDEADKLANLVQSGEWSASVGTDIFNLLDGQWPIEAYLRDTKFEGGGKPTPELLRELVGARAWIVGSGTWQAVFEEARAGTRIGFFGAGAAGGVGREAIVRSGVIAPELLHRFNTDLIFLEYPGPQETEKLLRDSGIRGLARMLGEEVRGSDIDWTQGGMRVLEAIGTRLALRYHAEAAAPRQEELPLFAVAGSASSEPDTE